MTIASFFTQHGRRVAVIAGATVLLHLLTLDWLGANIDPLTHSTPPVQPRSIVAQLRLALPAPRPAMTVPPAAKPAPKPASKPASKPAPKESPKPPPEPILQPDTPKPEPDEAADDADAVDNPDGTGDGAPGGAMSVTPKRKAAAKPVAETPPPEPPPAPVQAPVDAPRHYRVSLPPAADFMYDMQRTDANGKKWTAVAAMSWQPNGASYKLTMEAGISMLVTRVNLLVLTSEGSIDDNGIAPLTSTEKRKGRAMTATHFNRDNSAITFSASEKSYPLVPGAQDKATVPFQLAGIGRADVNQFSGHIDMMVGEDKDASMYRFELVGEDEIDTGVGRLVTWHLTRPPKPGTYSSRLDVWLAPSVGWYPVQIRNTEGNGAVTTQTVSSITPR
jgi:hypothetical protein